MLEILKSIILGIVEGITEWLPVSSTGHLILVNEFIKLKQSDEFIEMFDVVIQLGAIMAVVVIFWKKLWPFGKKKQRSSAKQFAIRTNGQDRYFPDVVQGSRSLYSGCRYRSPA